MTIITAREARELVATSESIVASWMEKVSIAITQAAIDGKQELRPAESITSGSMVFQIKKEPFREPVLSAFQERIKKELTSIGYGVTLKKHTYTPSGWGVMDEDPQPVTDYIFTITW